MRSMWFSRRARDAMVKLTAGVLPVVAVLALVAGPLVGGATAPSALAAEHHTWYVTVGVQTPDGKFSGMLFTPSSIYIHRGDTIVWTVGAQEIHTVTFGSPPADTDNEAAEGIPNPLLNAFEELEEQFETPAGGHSFDGVSYYNSGVMTTVPRASGFPQAIRRYSLSINAPVGEYTFYCLVHGPMMSQVVHVIPNSQPYPFTQAQYDAQSAKQRNQVFKQGREAYRLTKRDVPENVVYAGASAEASEDIGQADVMRFIRTNTTVEVNTPVTFINESMDPHTITIGSEAAMPGGGLLPFGDRNNIRLGQNVSSGVFGAAFTGLGLPSSVTFTFTQPGVYHYFCIFHDYEGMVGTITVTRETDDD